MSETIPPILQVAAKAAIINPLGQILILREASTGKDTTKEGQWGLIGGRLNPGEGLFKGLKREVKEESGLEDITISEQPIYVSEWYPVIRGIPHHIVGIFMRCQTSTDVVELSDEHDDYAWIDPAERHKYEMMEPDCFVIDKLVTQ